MAFVRASSLVIFSLYFRCMSDVAMNVCTYDRFALDTASISLLFARASAHISQLRFSSDMSRTAWASPADITGNPASMTSTPNSSNLFAMVTFCGGDSETPGVCSPSRSVVSKSRIFMIHSSAVRLFPYVPSL